MHIAGLACIQELQCLGHNVGKSSHQQHSQGPHNTLSAPIPHQPTKLIHSVDISVAGNELFHHALHCQAGRQDQCRRAICHAGIQVCGAVPDKNLGKMGCSRESHGRNKGTRSTSKPSEAPNPHMLWNQ